MSRELCGFGNLEVMHPVGIKIRVMLQAHRGQHAQQERFDRLFGNRRRFEAHVVETFARGRGVGVAGAMEDVEFHLGNFGRSHIAQIQCEWKFRIFNRRRNFKFSLRVAVPEKARQPAALGLVAVHRKRVVAASARMRDVISAAAERTLVPSVVKIKPQRRVRRRWSAANIPAAATRGSARRRRLRRSCRSDAAARDGR